MILQAKLWNYLEEVAKNQMMVGASEEQAERVVEDRKWEIIDICFGKNDLAELELLEQIDEVDRLKKRKMHQVRAL